MSVVINELTIEPGTKPRQQATPPASESGSGGGGKPSPQMERELEKLRRRMHERAVRLWAH